MNSHPILIAGLIAFASSVIAAPNEIIFEGPASANLVCSSITNDDATKMKIELRRASKLKQVPAREIHQHYSCNELSLIDFAYDWKAQKVIGYLERYGERRGSVTMEEVASL